MCLFPCLQVEISSLRLLSILPFRLIIWSFSSMQRLHRPDCRLCVLDCVTISQFIEYSAFFSLSCQMCFESSVSFLYRSCLNDLVWLWYLFLNSPLARPMYDAVWVSDVTVALYMTSLTKQLPRSGQLPGSRQLHVFSWGVGSLPSLLWSCVI